MRHWSQIAIRNWRAKPGRTAAATVAIALGVGVVVWVTCSYESVRRSVERQVWSWIGQSHVTVESLWGHRDTINQAVADKLVEMTDIVDTVTCRYTPQLMVSAKPLVAGDPASAPADRTRCEVIGIQPETEYVFRDYHETLLTGELLAPDDATGCVIDDTLAAQLGLGVGDTIYVKLTLDNSNTIFSHDKTPTGPQGFTIVGIVRNRRIARFHPPIMLVQLEAAQAIAPLTRDDGLRVTNIDIKLVDPTVLRDRRATARVLARFRKPVGELGGTGTVITTAQSKLGQIDAARRQTQLVLLLIASVALVTAFFIILSTLSMGMVERIRQMGVLRCLGVTRIQMGGMAIAEIVPMGVVGTVLGVPIGLGLAALSVLMVPDYLGEFAVHWPGVGLAVAGGMITTLAGGALPAFRAMRVTPLEATRPEIRPIRWFTEVVAAFVGLMMIGGHSHMIDTVELPQWLKPHTAIVAVMLIYGGYALLMPLLIRLASLIVVHVAAVAFRLRAKLLHDQFGKVTWRSAGICCGLMVGLSLIVCLVVHSESVIAGWDFPSQLAEGFVWGMGGSVPKDRADQAMAAVALNRAYAGRGDELKQIAGDPEKLRQLYRSLRERAGPKKPRSANMPDTDGVPPIRSIDALRACIDVGERLRGIRDITPVTHVIMTIQLMGGRFNFANWGQYVVGDPDSFFKMARVTFPDTFENNDEETAMAKFRKGGYVFVTSDFARGRGAEVGDKIKCSKGFDLKLLFLGGRSTVFEVAGIVEAPAINIAANFFQASGQLAMSSSTSVFGTFADAKRLFGIDDVRLFLLDFNLPDEPPPPGFAERSVEALTAEFDTASLPLANPARMTVDQRWRWYREQCVLRDLAGSVGMPSAMWGSVQSLKETIDREINRATLLFTSIPAVALIVAALGVANLMMANVHSRSREIAVLRAVGATKWQISRLVLAEALVLGLLGGAVGVGLGLHLAYGINQMTLNLVAYQPTWTVPWGKIAVGMALTSSICLVAGLLPARHAARSDIAGALQPT